MKFLEGYYLRKNKMKKLEESMNCLEASTPKERLVRQLLSRPRRRNLKLQAQVIVKVMKRWPFWSKDSPSSRRKEDLPRRALKRAKEED